MEAFTQVIVWLQKTRNYKEILDMNQFLQIFSINPQVITYTIETFQ